MKKRIVSVVLALCLCISSHSVVYASQEEPLQLLQQGDVLMEESTSGLVTRDSTIPTPTEAYEAMIALKDRDEYKEGTTWTNDEPYSDSKGYYHWKGGPLDGKNISAVGCVAFAFILSDEAFGSLPASMYATGDFTFEDIKVGDILRVSNDAHTVIVLEVSEAGVVVAEGNISTGDHKGKVHWGRAISKEEVMSNTSHYITRYPKDYIPPEDPEANVSIASGTLEGGLTWNLTKAGTLTISGKGAMPDFSAVGEQPWIENNSKIKKVVIGNGVTSIGSCAFWECGVLSVEISPSVTTINNSAFRSSSIISVNIPSSVKTIGDSAFRACQNLSSVTISEGLEKIEQNAFNACANLTSIALPASIGEVGAAAFFQCQNMTSATFAPGSKQVKLGDNLFTQCYYLSSVTLPKSIDCISEGMFQNCLMLTRVEIPQGAESIGMSAFASCSRLTTVVIPDSVGTIGISAFASSLLTDIYFTGTEAQWKSISKLGDTAMVVSKATMHYNYIPPTSPDPDDTEKADISRATMTLSQTSYTYDGKAKTPSVTVKLDGKTLVLNTDYTVSYSNNTNVGTAKVTITGKGNYTGSKTADFTITKAADTEKADISRATMTLSQTSYTYDGKAKTPSVTVKLDGKTLVLNTDYTVSYSNNTNVGTAKVTITGKGNYTGSKTADFTITKAADTEKADISKATMTLSQTSYTYDGKAKTPSVTVKLDGKTLVLNTDYTVSYSNNINVGTAKVTITGKGNYTGSKTADFTITKAADTEKADISKATMTLSQTSYTYDGKAKTPSVTVKLDNKTLVLNTDYTISYSNNTNVGTAKVTITGKGNYTGSKTADFTITKAAETEKADISRVTMTLSQTSYTYDGKAKTPSVTVKLDGKTLVFNADYTISYSNNTKVGTAKVTITGKGNYMGSKTASFTIKKADISKATMTLSQTSYTYNGKAKTPSVTVKLDGKTLALNTDYTISYSNNTKVGTAKVTITGKGNYTGKKTVSFTIKKAATVSITCKKTLYKVAYGTKPFKINASSKSKMTFTSSKPKIAAVNKDTGKVTIKNTGIATITIKAGKVSKKVTIEVSPKKPSVKSAQAVKGKKLTVKWAKDKMASGYQVQVSTDKKFKKDMKSKKISKTSYTFTKLKTGKKYYVRLRSYKESDKGLLYGTWSKVKLSSKIKK